jgi:hypothetical protein
MSTHDLSDFLISTHEEMEREYNRIQKRVLEDPGTAGDQGEENWATLLKNWLPPNLQIVTKGRILSKQGIASPQVDIIILQPEYPKYLLDKKLYLEGGVVAIFECKITLKSKHIEDFFKNCIEIKSLSVRQGGTLYRELHCKIIYGLLAHSHDWKKENSTPIENIQQKIWECDKNVVTHPILMPDVICVADLAAWNSSKISFLFEPIIDPLTRKVIKYVPGFPKSGYMCFSKNFDKGNKHNPISSLVTILLYRLAWENQNIRTLSDYFFSTNVRGKGSANMRNWPITIYSEEVQQKLLSGSFLTGKIWDEWCMGFGL